MKWFDYKVAFVLGEHIETRTIRATHESHAEYKTREKYPDARMVKVIEKIKD
jgi:hypothetical protein